MKESRIMRIVLILLSLALPVASQEGPATSKPPCLASDETVYSMGGDVKPPQPQPDKKAKNPPEIHGSMLLEVLVNSEGRVCNVRIVNATDRLSAQKNANFIQDHWTFKPATKQGKAVAVKFQMTFNK
jgi:TonB family protein